MKPVTVSASINRPREDVYALLDDLSRHEAFTDHFMVDWRLTRDDPRGVGAGVRVRGKGSPRAEMDITVVEATPPERIVEEGRSGKGMARRTRGTYTLAPAAGGAATDVTFTLELEPAGLGDRLASPLMRAYLRRQNARAMERLRELLERPGAGAEAASANGGH